MIKLLKKSDEQSFSTESEISSSNKIQEEMNVFVGDRSALDLYSLMRGVAITLLSFFLLITYTSPAVAFDLKNMIKDIVNETNNKAKDSIKKYTDDSLGGPNSKSLSPDKNSTENHSKSTYHLGDFVNNGTIKVIGGFNKHGYASGNAILLGDNGARLPPSKATQLTHGWLRRYMFLAHAKLRPSLLKNDDIVKLYGEKDLLSVGASYRKMYSDLKEPVYQKWRVRIKEDIRYAPTTIQWFFNRKMLRKYDFEEKKFPARIVIGHSIDLAAIGTYSIETDKQFFLDGLKFSSEDAKAFKERNTFGYNGFHIFVSMTLTLTGVNLEKPGGVLTARIDNFKGHNYAEIKQGRTTMPQIGSVFRTWSVDEPGEATISFSAKYRPSEEGASPLARKFKLRTMQGHILVNNLQKEELEFLKNFLYCVTLSLKPTLLNPSIKERIAACIANNLLPKDERAKYLNLRSVKKFSMWKGSNEFEVERSKQVFLAEAAPILMEKAVPLPIEFISIHRIFLGRYNMETHQFKTFQSSPDNLFESILPLPLPGLECVNSIYLTPQTESALYSDWKIPPDNAEQLVNRLDKMDNKPRGRSVYFAVVSELVPASTIEGKESNHEISAAVNVKSVKVYEDKELKHLLHTFTINR